LVIATGLLRSQRSVVNVCGALLATLCHARCKHTMSYRGPYLFLDISRKGLPEG
jgi:hypothetical protein